MTIAIVQWGLIEQDENEERFVKTSTLRVNSRFLVDEWLGAYCRNDAHVKLCPSLP